MRFEDALPLVRCGKKIRRQCWSTRSFLFLKNGSLVDKDECCYVSDFDTLLAEDWETVKEKFKYYPVLVQSCNFKDKPYITDTQFKTVEDAKKHFEVNKYCEVIRMVTEIPELIDERDE